jgi:L-serine dehydratase
VTISVFELFKVGIGPSSSHTVGPMRAAANFVADLDASGVLARVADVRVELYGSLAATGRGHGTLSAVLLGLEGYRPETIESEEVEAGRQRLANAGKIMLGGRVPIALSEDDIALYTRTVLDFHPNGMTLSAYAADDSTLYRRTYYSIGGGFVVTEGEAASDDADEVDETSFSSAAELLALASGTGRSISEVMLAHECGMRSAEEVRAELLHLRDVMVECEQRGIGRTGLLPGALHVRRRAGQWHERLSQEDPNRDPRFAEDWVNLVALAVNEENASGGRIVTAPTNGAAGIIPAVLHYAVHYTEAGTSDPDGTAVRFLLTAGAIGSLYKERASISGAEVGCQGEVGSASSMAAAG